MSEPGLTNQWEPWQRLIDSIGLYYRSQLLAARDQARGELCDLDEEQVETVAAEGRRVANSLDEEGARLTVTLTDDRERHSRLTADLQREAELLLRRRRWALASSRKRQGLADAAERADQAEEHRRQAAQAHEQLRELGTSGRHLCPWFERHRAVLARGMAAELSLDAAQSAVYHLLGGPRIASLTAACLTTDQAIDLGQLQELVKNGGEARQRLLFAVAAELYGRGRGVSLSELLAEPDDEDLDRELEAIAVVKRRRSTIQGSPDVLWIRAPNRGRGPRAAAGVDWSARASLRWCLTRGTLATGSSRRVTTDRARHPAARGRGAGWLQGVTVSTRRGPTC